MALMTLDTELRAALDNSIVRNGLGAHLGFVLEDADVDLVRIRLPFRDEITTMGDLVHGGSTGALIDTAATAAAWTGANFDATPRGTTINYTVNFMQGARGTDIIATARVIRRGGSICVIDVGVHDTEDAHIAQALVTYKLSHGG